MSEKDWISVKDRLPEYDGEYLCLLIEPQECANEWEIHQVVSNRMNKWIVKSNQTVTHWMQLPAPPKQNKP